MLVACQGSELERPIDQLDIVSDTSSDTSADTSPDVVVESSLRWWFATADDGTKCLDESVCELVREDEPAAYAGVPGFQVEVQVEMTGVSPGTLVSLVIDGEPVGQGVATFGGGGTTGVRFTNVTIPAAGEVTVTVSSTDVDGVALNESKVVTTSFAPCPVTVTAELDPTTSCAVLGVDDANSLGLTITVHHGAGICDMASLSYTFGGMTQDFGAIPFDDAGDAMFRVAFGEDAAVEGDLIVTARAVHPTVETLSGEVEATWTVDNVAPVVTITGPVGQIGPIDDIDPDTLGVQVDVGGEVDDDNTTLELRIDGDVAGGEAIEPEPGTYVFSSVSFTEDGVSELRVTATDSCGNASDDVVSLTVVVNPAEVAITDPLDGATLLAVDDRDVATTTIYEADVTVSAPSAADGDSVVVECGVDAIPPTWTEVGAAAVDGEAIPADGLYAIAVTLDVDALGNDLVCRARVDSLLNPGVSEVIGVTVGLPAPTLGAITSPTPEACLTTDSWTVAGAATGLDGQDVAVRVLSGASVALTTTGGPVAADAYDFAVDASTLADGAYTLSLDATDGFGNVVSATQGAPTVAVVRDTTAPVVSITAPVGAIDPGVVPDEDDGTAGYQTTVTLRLADVHAAGGELCLSVGGVEQGCKVVAAGQDQASWPGVTLGAGDTELVASGKDFCGLAAAAVTATVTLTSNPPSVAITEPAADTLTAATTATIVAAVTGSDGTSPIIGASVTLNNGGTDTGVAATDNGDGSYTFVAVPLAGGANAFTVAATTVTGTATSATRVITRKTATPTIALTVPAAGAINLTTAACQGTAVDCTLDATATTTEAEDGSAAQLTVDCDGTIATVDGTVASGAVTFAGVVLTHGATCTLTPSVTDVLEQTAMGAAVIVTVDRVAPTVAITSPIANQLVFNQDADAATPGIQHTLTAGVRGVEAGQVVTATLVYTNPANATTTTTLTHMVTSDTDDASVYVAMFEDVTGAGTVTFFDGTYAVSVAVSDAAGNAATPATKTLLVQSEEAYVRVTFPNYVAPTACSESTPCGAGRVCNVTAGLCYDAWQIDEAHNIVTTTAGLLTTTQNLRICSNHPSLAGTGAATCATDLGDGTTFYELILVDSAGGPDATDIGAVVPAGFQTVVAEILPVPNGLWLSSEAPGNAVTERDRLLFVDLVRPTVTSVGSPSDSLPPFGVLNAAEQTAPTRRFDIAFTASEAGTATVYVNGVAGTPTAVAAGANVILTQLVSGANTIYVILEDAVGNQSAAPPTPGVAIYSPTVDIIPPSLSFVTPASSPVKMGDNLDVRLASTAEGRTVTLRDGGTTVGTATVSGGNADFPHAAFGALSDGTHTLTAMVSDTAGNVTTAVTTPAEVVVDTAPPSGTINAPSDQTTFNDTDDADPAPGYQISVDFGTADGAVSWSLWTASNCDSTFTACDAPVVKKSGTVTNAGGDEPAELVTIELSAATTRKQLILETVDGVGNTATASVDLTFVVLQCTLTFDDVPSSDWYNATSCASGTSCATANVTISVSQIGACVGVTEIQLLDGSTVLGTDSLPVGTSTFVVALNDGASLQLEGKAFIGGGEVASTGVRAVKADFTPPAVAFVAATIDGFAAPTAGATLAWNADLDHAPLTPGFQFNARVQVTDASVSGGAITSVSAVGAGGTVALIPSNVTFPAATTGPSPTTRDLLDMTLGDLDTHVVTVNAIDAAGNPGSSSFTAKVDVTRPDPVNITQISVISKRRVRSIVRFVAVGDNGTTGGPVARYDMRYSRSPITEDNVDGACDFRDLYITTAVPVPAAPGTVQSGQVGAPDRRAFSNACKLAVTFDDGISDPSDPLWYFAVRAVDAAGNMSLLGPSSVGIQTRAEMQLDVDRIVFSSAAGSVFQSIASFFPFRGNAIGDVNDDGVMDLATGSEAVGAFCVLYGHDPAPEEVLTTATGANHDCLLSATSLFTGSVPKSAAAAINGLGDINGDGVDDFGVTGRFGDGVGNFTGEGFALIYLGRTGGPDLANPDVVIRGLQHVGGVSGASNIALCGVGDFDGLDDGGGTADDLGVGEPAYNRFHVIPGRTTWTPGQARVTIDFLFDSDNNPTNGEPDDSSMRVSNRVFSVYGPTFAITSGLFGAQCGAAGDILPTPAGGGSGAKGDVVFWQSGSSDARLFVIPGREYTAGTIVNVSQSVTDAGFPTSEDSISVRLRQESAGIQAGFGANFRSNVDVTGDFVPDIIAGCRRRSSDVSGGDGKSVYIFDGAKLASLVGTDVRVNIGTNPKVDLSWRGTNGFVLDVPVNSEPGAIGTAGNFDEFYSGSPPTPGTDLLFGGSGFGRVRLRSQHKLQNVIEYGQYPVQDGELTDIFGAGALALGTWIAGGFDLDNDGKLDFATGGGAGQILIVH
ncbi:MAG: hypothetical protein CVU56_09400 [Deltaproteobacteria bacterium HGW-Deltaproteobacteria-14]|nr:MAG: hypothetical protein CVU56_09400 [Deltaproteobacteria bacterium HGW-Deltaproteobacteria-14]